MSEGLSILHKALYGYLVSQIVDILAFCLNAPLLGNADELLRILYLVVSVRRRAVQGVADLTAMVRVGCSSAGCELQIITSYNTVYVTSADTSRRLGCNTAGTHRTDSAADALLTELTVGGLVLHTKLPGIGAHLRSCFQQSGCCGFKFFHRC
ncbi:hypothetical protein IMSAGC007_02805 [Lachnospiraceae bacterium]|nr:hypothetical protein IMSAGC007_02805 [Lachnospiraceae bacterium]